VGNRGRRMTVSVALMPTPRTRGLEFGLVRKA
jgi:hypothetical protein